MTILVEKHAVVLSTACRYLCFALDIHLCQSQHLDLTEHTQSNAHSPFQSTLTDVKRDRVAETSFRGHSKGNVSLERQFWLMHECHQMKPVVEKEGHSSHVSDYEQEIIAGLKITETLAPLRQVIRLHGYSCMKAILEVNADDPELIILCMTEWPSSSRKNFYVNESVSVFMESEIKIAAYKVNIWSFSRLYKQWQKLELTYQTPERQWMVSDCSVRVKRLRMESK
ncbi:hypothetical protein K435DRAFT_793140 [Dendrothele bispora CBS 962.96]|uniref:Uncharacterized protein n=1 Tax=Dendrothele bispora (strain CBS 962.96) TaxID=1314807 RepID=A0A4S8MG80_DENBC|nr:hypothetical protein K435DRAFT_793140 [Dendrothele bispora CBS 962.96]